MTKHKIDNRYSKLRTLEYLVLVVAIIEPLSTLPQIIEVFASQDARSLSLLSWILFMSASLIWLVYGIKIKNQPLIASSVLWVGTELLLITGIVVYS